MRRHARQRWRRRRDLLKAEAALGASTAPRPAAARAPRVPGPRRRCPWPTERGASAGGSLRAAVLRAAYEATLAVGALKARDAGRRQAVYLTSLGGGAFGNRDHWITDSVRGALDKFRDAPLDVYKVHYGTRVQGACRDVGSEYPEPEGRGARHDPPSGRAGSEQLCRPS